MARSTYIYVVTDLSKMPQAAFTVKHELVSWIKKMFSDKRVIYKTHELPIYVFKMKDNPRELMDRNEITPHIIELLEKEI